MHEIIGNGEDEPTKPTGLTDRDFRVTKVTGFVLNGKTGVLELYGSQGADTETWIFSTEEQGPKVVKFIRDEVINSPSWEGNELEEKARDIREFYKTIRGIIGPETIVSSDVIISSNPNGERKVAIVQNFQTQDASLPSNSQEQIERVREKYNRMRELPNIPQRWKRRMYDALFSEEELFWIEGNLLIVDWL